MLPPGNQEKPFRGRHFQNHKNTIKERIETTKSNFFSQDASVKTLEISWLQCYLMLKVTFGKDCRLES